MIAQENQIVVFDPEAIGISLNTATRELLPTPLEGLYLIVHAATCPPDERQTAVAQVEAVLAKGGIPPGSTEWCICQPLEGDDMTPCILADMGRILAVTTTAEA